jgi:UDP-glucose 4-epimerase
MPMNPTQLWPGTQVLVTGGAGFIGSHLVDRLVRAGARVRVLDNLQAGREANLTQSRREIDFRVADLRDPDAVARAVQGCAIIFHIGANASVPASVNDRDYDFRTNTLGTYHIADAAIRHGVRRVVFASTAAVYGPPRYTPIDEAHPLDPISPYGASKLAAERLLVAYARTFDLELTAVRIFNTYGPRQPRYVAYDLMMKLARDPHRLEVLGTGEQKRDYAYIDDTVSAILMGGEASVTEPLIYNIAGGRTVTIRELVGLILHTLNLEHTEVVYGLPSWKGDIEILSGDITRLRGLGWVPTVTLEEGLRRLAAQLGLIEA